MRCLILFMILGTLQSLANATYSQSVKFNLHMENASIEEILSTIEKESQFYFTYSVKEIDAKRNTSINAENVSIEEVLGQLFVNGEIKYVIRDKHIALYHSGKSGIRSLFQQQRTLSVSGNVKDNAGQPILGGTVVLKGTSTGTATDFDGNYTIHNIPEDGVLIFSYIGMQTQEVKVNGRSVIHVTLQEDAIGLDEVIAIGYGYQRKRDLTGSIATVSADDMVMGGTVSNAAQALQGKTAGVQVNQTSKAPGGTISVRVRGNNSISSTNDPLYVVDGFPSSEGLNINPNDIESMQILKDASATAIYGARGANGVVLITTKRGKTGENKISYSGYMGVQKVNNPFDMMNAKDYMNMANALFQEIEGQAGITNGAYTSSQLESNVNTDWIDVCTRLGLVQDHNIQFRGGSEKTKVLTSLGYFNQDGVLKNTNFSRISGRVNVDQTINDYIKAGASIFAHREKSNYQLYSGNIVNSNVLLSILEYDPTVLPYNTDGSYGRVPGGRGDNPLANLLERKNDQTNDKLNGSAFVEIEPVTGLKGKVNAGVEILHNFRGSYLPASTYQGGIDNGVASTYDYTGTRQLLETLLTYHKTFNTFHDFSGMLGYSYEKFAGEYRRMSAKDFSTDLFSYNNMGAAAKYTEIASNKIENLLVSFFGRVNYTYKDKYMLTFTVRRDGSSRFGMNNHWGTFPSGSLAWRLGDEEFIRNLNVFSSLKLRGGYGVTGNERIGDYASYALMSNTHLTFDGVNTSSGTHMNQSNPENSKLKWETTKQWNVGVDMGFIDNRLSVSIDGYIKKTDDLLLQVSLPIYSGFTIGQQNVGSIENKGIELDLTSYNFVGKDFTWNTKFNIAWNKNKVLDLGTGGDIYITSSKPMGSVSEEVYAVVREGESLGSLFGYKYMGVLQQGESYAPQPNSKPGDPKFEDVNNDGTIDSKDRTIIGHANPDFIYGLTNNFGWKNFDLSIFFQGTIGNDLFNMQRINMEWNRSIDALNRWTTNNTNTDVPRNGFYYITSGGGFTNDHFIENASYLRLKNLTLGYTIPFKKVVSSCRIYFSAENLFTVTGYSGWDPEVDTKAYDASANNGSMQTANAGAGLDFNSYPSMRTYTFGLNVTF
ncbi:MAG: TonB-dependent receptor [Tannerellaceae bacterium]|nr:TonB-dependent receptor [Tannerellaceae bacterium]